MIDVRAANLRTLFLALVVALGSGCKTKDVIVTLTRDEIQQRISARFPVTKSAFFVDVVLQEPTVVLPEGSNRIGIDMVVNVKIPLIAPLSGRIGATGVPRYAPASKEFYLDEPRIESLQLPALKPEHEPKVRAAVEKIAKDALARHPIYELKARNLKEVTAALVLKEVLVRDGKLQATLALP